MSEQQNALLTITKIEEETKCSICTCLYHDPHLLNCGHTFCGGCILHWFQQKKCCPKCRVPAIKQPTPIIALQNICDLLRPDDVIVDKKLSRSDWETLYPVENQSGYIRDEDQDGVIHRCSNCGWELDEENYCGNCLIHYDDGSIVNDNESDYNMQSDAGSHMDPQEDLDDFVVGDGQVEYEDVYDIHDDEEEEEEPVVRNHRKRRRVINLSDEEEEHHHEPIVIEDDDNDSNNSSDSNEENNDSSNEDAMLCSYGEEEEDEEEEEEEYPDDVFSRPKRSRFIDDLASEDDDDEEDEIRPKKVDKVMDTISKAKDKMKTSSRVNNESSSSSSSSTTSSSDSEDEPDYNL